MSRCDAMHYRLIHTRVSPFQIILRRTQSFPHYNLHSSHSLSLHHNHRPHCRSSNRLTSLEPSVDSSAAGANGLLLGGMAHVTAWQLWLALAWRETTMYKHFHPKPLFWAEVRGAMGFLWGRAHASYDDYIRVGGERVCAYPGNGEFTV